MQVSCRLGVKRMQQACSTLTTVHEIFTEPAAKGRKGPQLRGRALPRVASASFGSLKEKAAIKVNVLPATVDPEWLMWVEA